MAMIRSDKEYANTRGLIERIEEDMAHKRAVLELRGLTEEQVDKALEPSLCFLADLEDQCTGYKDIQRGGLEYIEDCRMGLPPGKLLIAIRIASGVSAHTVSNELEVDTDKDEYNDNYHLSHKELLSRARRFGDGAAVVMKRRLDLAFAKTISDFVEELGSESDVAFKLRHSAPTVRRWMEGEKVPVDMQDSVLGMVKTLRRERFEDSLGEMLDG